MKTTKRIAARLMAGATLSMAAMSYGCTVSPPEIAPPAPPWESPLARDASVTGQIRAPRSGRMLTAAALIEEIAAADFILLGERHDNPDHHRLQAWIVEGLLARGRRFAVAFEMIAVDQANRLADYLAASPQDAAGLGAALEWDRSGWPAWRHYQPIAAAAMARGVPVAAANLPPTVARSVARDGLSALPGPLASRLQLDPAGDAALLADHREEISRAHCGMLPENRLGPFALAQYARDAQMARLLADVRSHPTGTDGAILITGNGHARTDRGVPVHLARMAPGARTVSIAFVEADDAGADGNERSALPYDFVWFTARIDDADPCATMKPIK